MLEIFLIGTATFFLTETDTHSTYGIITKPTAFAGSTAYPGFPEYLMHEYDTRTTLLHLRGPFVWYKKFNSG